MEAKQGSAKTYVDTPYDIFEENKLLFFIIGFAPIKNVEYWIYVAFMVGLQIFVQAMAFYAMYLVSPQKSLIFDALHVITASLFAVWGLLIRFCANKSLKSIMERIKAGIYKYEEEELDEEQMKMKASIPGEIRWKCNIITFMYCIGFTSNTVIFPLLQFFLFDEEENADYPDFLNPYISHVFYTPFNTRTALGYAAVYIMDFLFLLYIYVTAVSLNHLYIACTVYVKVHLKLLNYSIRNIQKRAYLLYRKNNNFDQGRITEQDLMDSKEFQKCLHFCLKGNVKHHQILLRFREDCTILVGSILLEVFIIEAIVYASTLYQMYQNLPLNVLLNYSLTSLAEQTYTCFIFTFGEELIGESAKVFLNLYGTSWYHYDEKFKRTLGIMLVNTRRSMNFKALIMNVPASLEAYGDLLIVMYKIMNIARQSDALN